MIIMIKELIIPKELQFLLSNVKDTRVKKRLLKVYEALVYKKGKTNGFFDVPSNYLEKINSRYYKAIELFIEYGIIEYKTNEYEPQHKYNNVSLFESKITKSYSSKTGRCMKYRFLINTNEGTEQNVNIDVDNLYKDKRWFNLTKKSLLELGLEPKIKRDNFSRRLHTNVTGNMSLENDELEIDSYKDFFN